MKMPIRNSIVLLTLVCMSALLYSAFAPLSEEYLTHQLQQGPLSLQVEPIQQRKVTSCGEAALTMAYNYLYPESQIKEVDVITYATDLGYYVEDTRPFTSPADMVKIAKHYADTIATGRVTAQAQGLILLFQKLQNNEPVIIDIQTRLNDPSSGAHFVVVTGISLADDDQNTVLIHYNNPLTARNESAPWAGTEGVWRAWQNNGDPGGAGWWLTIQASE